MELNKFTTSVTYGGKTVFLTSDDREAIEWAASLLRGAAAKEPSVLYLSFGPAEPRQEQLSLEDAAQIAEMEQLQRDCPIDHTNIPEDGCPSCGYNSQ